MLGRFEGLSLPLGQPQRKQWWTLSKPNHWRLRGGSGPPISLTTRGQGGNCVQCPRQRLHLTRHRAQREARPGGQAVLGFSRHPRHKLRLRSGEGPLRPAPQFLVGGGAGPDFATFLPLWQPEQLLQRPLAGASPGPVPAGRCAEPRPHPGLPAPMGRGGGSARGAGGRRGPGAGRQRRACAHARAPRAPHFLSGTSREASARLAAPPAGRARRESARSAPSPRSGRAGRRLEVEAVPGLAPRARGCHDGVGARTGPAAVAMAAGGGWGRAAGSPSHPRSHAPSRDHALRRSPAPSRSQSCPACREALPRPKPRPARWKPRLSSWPRPDHSVPPHSKASPSREAPPPTEPRLRGTPPRLSPDPSRNLARPVAPPLPLH